jgi:metal-dependent amidase/aminoacylase/carboxypeptidase family protein
VGQELALVQAQFLVDLSAYTNERKTKGQHVSAAVAFVHGGRPDTYNVLPTEIRLQGSTRAFDGEEHALLHNEMKRIAEAVYRL